MKDRLKIFFSRSYWNHVFSLKRALFALLSSFGSLWLIVEATSFFSSTAGTMIRGHWWLFLVGGVIWAVIENLPRHVVCHRLAGRDITLEIRVGDILDQSGG